MSEYFLVGDRKFVPDGHSVYRIIPKFPDNDAIPGTFTVAVQPLFTEPREGTKDSSNLSTGWQGVVESINTPEGYKVVQIQGGFWVNVPQLWARVQNIGISGQFVTGVQVSADWVKIDTNKLSDPPTQTYIHEVYMIDRQLNMKPIRPYPVKIILVSKNGFLYIQRNRLELIT